MLKVRTIPSVLHVLLDSLLMLMEQTGVRSAAVESTLTKRVSEGHSKIESDFVLLACPLIFISPSFYADLI